ncbi:MAG: hypothetical protein LBT05_06310 [Planctomycetaceae bacterium]|nr:hypothetical protein [Planctomycetaceae bacterium]
MEILNFPAVAPPVTHDSAAARLLGRQAAHKRSRATRLALDNLPQNGNNKRIERVSQKTIHFKNKQTNTKQTEQTN